MHEEDQCLEVTCTSVPDTQFATHKVIGALMLKQEGARGMYAEQNAMLDWSPAQQPKLFMCVATW